MPVFRHSLRWLTALLAVFPLLVARPAAAITRHDGTRPRFEESFVSKLPKDQQAMWKWVASGERGTLPFSGVLISDCHILTCAHAFFENASEGTGKLTADPKTISFSFPDPADPLNEKTPKYQAASVSILPEFMEKKDDGFYGKGHRKVGYDLAIVTLEKYVPNAKPYRYNDGTLIKDERDEKWSKDGGTIKVGYGRGGNGDVGAAFPGGLPRIMTNAVEEFGDGKTKYAKKPDEGRADAPPERTLVYDFDKKDENSGAGSGRYAPGTMVSVTADPAPAGQHFAGWTGDIVILSNPNITTTTAIIPSMDVGITATYRTNAQIRGSPGEESFGLSASSLDEHRADWVPGLPAEQ